MVLRFRSPSGYLAFNSVLEIYTTNRDEVEQGYVIDVSDEAFRHICGEIDFNCYCYAKNLDRKPMEEDAPLF